MRQLLPPLKVQFGLLLVVGLAFYGLSNLAIAGSGSDEYSGQQRLIKIIDGETERSVVSRASTVDELFTQENITVDEYDSLSLSRYATLSEKYYEITIKRARPVLISDGALKIRLLTAETTAEEIARAAGVTLYAADTTELGPVTDYLAAGGAGLQLTITRNDTVTEVAENEAIPYETEQQKDYSRDKDYKEIITPGEIGNRVNYYRVTIRAGKETARVLVGSQVSKEPVKQVEKVGIKYSGIFTTPSENESITWDYLINQGFTRVQAAGIMGNLKQEHGFQTSGDGLAQWTGGRKAALMALPNPYDIYTQLDFMMSELNSGYIRTKNQILAATTVEDATRAFQNGYERCGVCLEDYRISYAYNILASH